MSGKLAVINQGSSVISVMANDELIFPLVLPNTCTLFKDVPSGSLALSIRNNREKVIFDLWLSVAESKKHILEVSDTYFSFI